jgi:hypothetical protein
MRRTCRSQCAATASCSSSAARSPDSRSSALPSSAPGSSGASSTSSGVPAPPAPSDGCGWWPVLAAEAAGDGERVAGDRPAQGAGAARPPPPLPAAAGIASAAAPKPVPCARSPPLSARRELGAAAGPAAGDRGGGTAATLGHDARSGSHTPRIGEPSGRGPQLRLIAAGCAGASFGRSGAAPGEGPGRKDHAPRPGGAGCCGSPLMATETCLCVPTLRSAASGGLACRC